MDKKVHFGQFDPFRQFFTVWLGMIKIEQDHHYLITTGPLHSQDMIRILKQQGHDFWCKDLCDGYCMMLCDVYV